MNNSEISTQQLVNYCNNYLNIDLFKDYCPNGIQLQGKNQVKKIVAGVTASQALIDKAIANHADVLLVHHGFFWKGEDPVITGIKYQRLKSLMDHNINLLAYHLPLDAHKEIGNNYLLAKQLKIKKIQTFANQQIALIGQYGLQCTGWKKWKMSLMIITGVTADMATDHTHMELLMVDKHTVLITHLILTQPQFLQHLLLLPQQPSKIKQLIKKGYTGNCIAFFYVKI